MSSVLPFHFLSRLRSRFGYLILETLIAITALAFVVINVFPAINFMLRRSKVTSAESQAGLLLQEGLEVPYNIFLTNWNAYGLGDYKISQSASNWELVPGTESDIQAKFTRKITISQIYRDSNGKIINAGDIGAILDVNSRVVVVTISWDEAGVPKTPITGKLLLFNLPSF